MTNIGLIGSEGTNRTRFQRYFIKFIKEHLELNFDIVKTDFSGESILLDPETGKLTGKLLPNKVVFMERDTGKYHAILAPSDDRSNSTVKMGVITISRIAREIIAFFTADRPIEEQFDFYDNIRHFPREIDVCINYSSLQDKDKIREMEQEIAAYFEKRKIKIRAFYIYNEVEERNTDVDNLCMAILDIATKED
ncbi:MAG: hypothetical protein ACTSU2_08960 [Promethearchaeota archaeon]